MPDIRRQQDWLRHLIDDCMFAECSRTKATDDETLDRRLHGLRSDGQGNRSVRHLTDDCFLLDQYFPVKRFLRRLADGA